MPQSIIAVYEDGILRPLEPLTLHEKQRVRIQVEPENQVGTIEQLYQSLIDKGQLTPPAGRSRINPISLKKRRRAAAHLGKAVPKPVSEMIIEDRGEL